MKIKLNNKIIFAITFGLQLLIFVFLLTKNIMIKTSAEKHNRVYSFDCTVYDPYDVMKGRYVRLENAQAVVKFSDFDDETVSELKENKLLRNEMVYVMLKENEQGFWQICGVRRKKPKLGDFIKAKFIYNTKDDYHFDFLINEYYLQENYADYMDLRGRTFEDIKLEVYCDGKGNVLQKQLYVLKNGKYTGVEEYCKSVTTK